MKEKKANLLFADNDDEFLETRSSFLEREGYEVLRALNPLEAKIILEKREVDLAIIDLRLLNDNDDKDLSGLNLARQIAHSVPKIILTKFPTVEAVREALAPHLEGLPPAVDFVAKQEGPQALLTAIRKVLKLESQFRELTSHIANSIAGDYDDARQQARMNFRASLGMAIIGMVAIFIGVAFVLGSTLEAGVPSLIAGVIVEAVGLLFFKRADTANVRMDNYHRELFETRQFDNLLAACDELQDDESRVKCRLKVIEIATTMWLGQSKVAPQILSSDK